MEVKNGTQRANDPSSKFGNQNVKITLFGDLAESLGNPWKPVAGSGCGAVISVISSVFVDFTELTQRIAIEISDLIGQKLLKLIKV